MHVDNYFSFRFQSFMITKKSHPFHPPVANSKQGQHIYIAYKIGIGHLKLGWNRIVLQEDEINIFQIFWFLYHCPKMHGFKYQHGSLQVFKLRTFYIKLNRQLIHTLSNHLIIWLVNYKIENPNYQWHQFCRIFYHQREHSAHQFLHIYCN